MHFKLALLFWHWFRNTLGYICLRVLMPIYVILADPISLDYYLWPVDLITHKDLDALFGRLFIDLLHPVLFDATKTYAISQIEYYQNPVGLTEVVLCKRIELLLPCCIPHPYRHLLVLHQHRFLLMMQPDGRSM